VIGFPVAAALVADLAPVELRGRYQGAFSMSWGVAFTASPLLAGEVIARLGGRALWVACLGIAAAVAAGYLATGADRRRRVEALHAPAAPAAGARHLGGSAAGCRRPHHAKK
jgi:MFS family permease